MIILPDASICPIVYSVASTYEALIPSMFERHRRILPWRERVLNTNREDLSVRRTYQVLDWHYRRYAPFLIREVDYAGLGSIAVALENICPISSLLSFNAARHTIQLMSAPLYRSAGLVDTPERRALFGLVILHGSSSSVRTEQEAFEYYSTCLSNPFSYVRDGAKNTEILFNLFEGLLDRIVDR